MNWLNVCIEWFAALPAPVAGGFAAFGGLLAALGVSRLFRPAAPSHSNPTKQ